jgi:hypothetical protein
MLRLLTYGMNESSIHEIVEKERQIHSGFAVISQTAGVTTTVRISALVKMERC